MEIQVLFISIVTYLLLFNNCLTFRLTIKNNVIITAVLVFHMAIVGNYIGSLFIIPTFLILMVYIGWLKKEDWFFNVFLIVSAYMMMVVLDNMMHLVWSFIGWTASVHWPMYMITNYPVYFALWRWMVKKVCEIKDREFMALPPKTFIILGLDMVVCMCIFSVNIRAVEQAGSSSMLLFCSIILYITYFVLTFLMVAMIVREYETNAKIMMRQNSYDNLQEYMAQIETLYQNLRVFKHDYANVMASIAGYIEADDLAGLKKYYDKQILPVSKQFIKSDDAIARLCNLDMIELKGLISVKLNYALERGIEVNLEIMEKIDNINMKSVDLVRVIGILLDNAIEACQTGQHPCIGFSIVKTNEGVIFIIKNTYVKQDIDYSRLGSIGVSSKGARRGVGLYNIKSIISQYDNVVIDTEYGNSYFTQQLVIYEIL